MSESSIAIIDYGMGNLKSVSNALNHLGYSCHITNDPAHIRDSNIIILPGVGAFGTAMKNLRSLGLDSVLTEEVMVKKKPFLGICLGMQLIAETSDEKGSHSGLGWIKGKIKHLPETGLRIPHVGWNILNYKDESPLYQGLGKNPSVYFVHSYYMECNQELADAYSDYGLPFTVSVCQDNIHAVQYHPEKSHHTGLHILQNFLTYAEEYQKGGSEC